MAVNGGGKLIVRVTKAGYFEVHRDVIVPWQDFVHAPDIVLTPPDSVASPVNLAAPVPQVARANAVTDASGTRRATLIVLPGTTAQFRMPDGSLKSAPTNLTVRQTEYTVGPLGPASMPSELPPQTAYTYYLELTADEALAAGAIGVEFNQSVVFYLENFLAFPVGAHAPVGFYDRQQGVWKGEPDGRVVSVVASAGGAVDLDTDGNGTPDNGVGTGQGGGNLGITLAERQTLAGLYAAGQSLWRVETPHFSPGDINWPWGPPPDAIPPNGGPPTNEEPRKTPCDCPPCQGQGSIIECGNQTLGETIPIAGTGMSLVYRSDRVPGRREANRVDIPITGATVPASLASTLVEVTIAGQQVRQAFGNAAAQSTSFSWDGKDVYGRVLQGAQKARVRVGFEYPSQFQATPEAYYRSWALASGNPIGITGRNLSQIFREHDVWLGGWDARGQGFGGWTLSAHHVYDHRNRVLYMGTGERRRETDALAPVVGTIAGNGAVGIPVDGANALQTPVYPQGSPLAIEPDGGIVFFSSVSGVRLMRLRPDGTVQRISGGTSAGAPLFGVPASQANVAFAHKFALGPDGSLYVTHRTRHVVTRMRPGGAVVEHFAGTLDQGGFTGDGGPATAARFSSPGDIAVAADGSVYVHDQANRRIRRIGPDGIVNTIAGNGGRCSLLNDPQCADGPALGQKIAEDANRLTVAPDGTLYATRPAGAGLGTHFELYRIGSDGILRVIGGKRDLHPNGVFTTDEGALAIDASFTPVTAMAVDATGTLFFTYTYSFSQKVEIRFIDGEGRMRVLAGSQNGYGGDGGPARAARFAANPPGIAFGPSGELVIADQQNYRLRRLQSRFPGFSGASDLLIPDASGSVVFRFDADGRHLQTLHGLTGAALLSFGYDTRGLLVTLGDTEGNVTTIQRDAAGVPTGIVAPFGQLTQLSVDANGWLKQVRNPANEPVALVHQADGLLTSITTPRGHTTTFAYDPATGLLLADADPGGGHQALARTTLPPDATRAFGHSVTNTTALGRTTAYRTERLRAGGRVDTAVAPDGTQRVMRKGADGSASDVDATGTESTRLDGPDPRWGMLAPLAAASATRLPSTIMLASTQTVTATLADPANVFSIATLAATATRNGRTSTAVYAGGTRTTTFTSAGGRTGTTTIDALGRVTAAQFGGLAPESRSYDARGRLASVTAGTGPDARTTSFAYNAAGDVASVTDALGRVTSYGYDAAGRRTSQTLPDGRVIAVAYDANGNASSVTPPGRPAHVFAHSPLDLETTYDPPDVAGATPDATTTAYDADRQATQVSRPDGRTIVTSYDAAGRIASVAFSRGSLVPAYSGTTGRMIALTAPEGIGHTMAFDGPLAVSHALTGPIPGVVAWTYDADFRTA
ncbi:MAG: hypothetical protein KJ018_11120, partial [Burkholderiales bacterium]|nr:hypothetical protein [Burkholderiales bacterium]